MFDRQIKGGGRTAMMMRTAEEQRKVTGGRGRDEVRGGKKRKPGPVMTG